MTGSDILNERLLTGGVRIHLIGVAGSGMSGIASLLLELGHHVSGSDKVDSPEVIRLQRIGLDFHTPHRAELVHDVDLVIYSSAIRVGNPAYDEALRLELPMVRRAEALAVILAARKGIVVAGMHGKTTTSAMTALVLGRGGLNPGHYVGAEIPILGTNSRWDPAGEYFVAEGDESDGTIRLFHPEHVILLNIEEEHLDYYADLEAIFAAYRTLLEQTAGTIVYCRDNENATKLAGEFDLTVSYGEHPDADYQIQEVKALGSGSSFTIKNRDGHLDHYTLGVPGLHNVCNAAGAIALACEIGLGAEAIAPAMENFRGAKRRFEAVPTGASAVRVVDDYGHHPTEIHATLKTAKEAGAERILVMFQPHRFSRTLALKDQFALAFRDADEVRITDIYPASEAPIEGITGEWLADIVGQQGEHLGVGYSPMHRIHHEIGNLAQPGDLILSLGAGNIHEPGKRLAADLAVAADLQARLGADVQVKLYQSLARYTTMQIGGPAQFYLQPKTVEQLSIIRQFCHERDLPCTAIGRGSNMLIHEGGIPGVVVRFSSGEFSEIDVDGEFITAGAGAKFKQVATAAAKAGLGGFEWMEGIPGSVGGGLRMNAGAMGVDTFEQVVRLRVVTETGEIRELNRDEVDAHYRETPILKQWFAVEAVFKGEPAEAADIEAKMSESMDKRKSSQPIAKSAGCIFRNPEQCPAGKLVDELGLKNFSVGPARVSEVHGNFIVNDGGATANDVLKLIDRIKAKARQQRGIEMLTEVQILGQRESTF